MDEIETGDSAAPAPAGARYPASLGLLIFGFGAAAGLMLAFAGLGVIEDSVGILLLIFLCTLIFIAAFGLMVYLFRKSLLRRLFGFAEAQVELFAAPLAKVARGAVDRDPQRAVDAAREVVQLALARYAWLSTRRWIIGSLTALIAAMAALAGTAMLYRQNELLKEQTGTLIVQNEMFREQTGMLRDQNVKLDRQIVLADLSVQLAEAARNAELASAIVTIAEDLATAVAAAERAFRQAEGTDTLPVQNRVALLDPSSDLDQGLIARIVAVSQSAKPYRFLDIGIGQQDTNQMIWHAALRRRDELPKFWSSVEDWGRLTENAALIDRPASPERGQLLKSMLAAGIHEFERFNSAQLDLSYAAAQGVSIFLCSLQVAQMRFADLSFATIRDTDFGGAYLENSRFRQAVILDTRFADVSGEALSVYFRMDGAAYATALTGADFSRAFLRRVDFTNAQAMLARFDGATLIEPDFTDASLSGATFRGAVLLDADLTGAQLFKSDFDGAVVVGADFATALQDAAHAGSFAAAHYALDPIDMAAALEVESLAFQVEPDEIAARVGDRGLYRLRRLAPLDD